VTVDYAIGKQVDEIIIGSRGRGVLSGALLGSVAQKVIHLSPVPVVVIT
jgi:nucleotide-binding universal stress UspA family protein